MTIEPIVLRYIPCYDSFLGQGKVTANIIMNAVEYKWRNNGFVGFLQYSAPAPNSPYYRIGQSWEEHTGWKEGMLKGALKDISTRVDTEMAEEAGFKNKDIYIKHLLRTSDKLEHLILINTDKYQRSWYFFNQRLFDKLVKDAKEKLAKKYNIVLNPEEEDEVDYAFRDYNKANEVDPLDGYMFGGVVDIKPTSAPKEGKKPKNTNMFKGIPMPQEYNLMASTRAKAIELGYDIEELDKEINKFCRFYKTGNGMNTKNADWDGQFLDVWLTNAYSYGNIKLNGKYKDGKQSSSEKRVETYSGIANLFKGATD